MTSTYDEAMEWLSDEGLEVSSAYSEEESHYNIDFEIRSTNEDASCAFHFEYSSDGDYTTYRHIIINVQEDLKSAFIEELRVWYSGALELENTEAKCFQKSGELQDMFGKRKRNMASFSQAFNDLQLTILILG
ncbi:MAG: hypothetical protein IPG07_10310 [Crocinitomicaceae bacterium]|nr:hypothetical protein [Crocinitomicaceae bacterium]